MTQLSIFRDAKLRQHGAVLSIRSSWAQPAARILAPLLKTTLAIGALLLMALAGKAQLVWQSSVTASGNTTPATVGMPTGTVEGDLMVVGLMFVGGDGVTVTPPAGWALIERTDEATTIGMATYYKIAGASEAGPYAFSLDPVAAWAIGISHITGASAVLPINASGEDFGMDGDAIAPSITTTVPNTLILSYFGRNNDIDLDAAGKRYQENYAPDLSNMLATAIQATAGATGDKAATGSTDNSWAAQQIAIAPAQSTYSAGGQTFTFTVPNEIPAGLLINVQAWGGGGGGSLPQGNNASSGGGGGAYARAATTVAPGAAYTIVIGNEGAPGAAGGDSFASTTASPLDAFVLAKGGGFGANGGTIGLGGAADLSIAIGVDAVKFSGGDGGIRSGSGNNNAGGGGGGSAFFNAAGNPGGNGTADMNGIIGGAGGSGTGDGGKGGDNGGSGQDGLPPGGGGGGEGAGNDNNIMAGSGASGQVIIEYICPTYSLSSTSATIVTIVDMPSTVTLEGDLPVGTYTVTYELVGSNAGTYTAEMVVLVAGAGTFVTVALSAVNINTDIFITKLSSGGPGGCSSDIENNNEAALPITLLTFSGEAVGSGVELKWRTGSELNNDYVAVERSQDGQAFDEIGRVPGAGDSNQPRAYAFRDDFPLPGTNYYRLRQVDYDGTMEYHPVIAVAFEGQSRLGLRAFPNPVEDELRVVWTAPQGRAQTPFLRLLDANGRLLGEYPVAGNGGVYNLPAAELPAGLYVLQLLQGGEIEVVKVLKK